MYIEDMTLLYFTLHWFLCKAFSAMQCTGTYRQNTTVHLHTHTHTHARTGTQTFLPIKRERVGNLISQLRQSYRERFWHLAKRWECEFRRGGGLKKMYWPIMVLLHCPRNRLLRSWALRRCSDPKTQRLQTRFNKAFPCQDSFFTTVSR